MKKKHLILIAGLLSLFTAVLHVVAGQISLMNPLSDSNLSSQIKTEMIGAWHMITVMLFGSAIILWKHYTNENPNNYLLLKYLGIVHLLFAVSFIGSSIWMGVFAPQWVLFLPIGIFILLGLPYNYDNRK